LWKLEIGNCKSTGRHYGCFTAISNYLIGGVMAEETAEQKLARLEAENRALREQVEQRRTGQLRMKVSEKGSLSVYGLGRFPMTLYKKQWIRLLDYADEIKSFLKENDQLLKAKQQRKWTRRGSNQTRLPAGSMNFVRLSDSL